MAAIGASSISLALGVYNTTQIQMLKGAVDSLTPGSDTIDVLNPSTVTQSSVVIEPKKITQGSFIPAQSADIAEIQERLSTLENFSNDISIDSSSISTNSSAGISTLQKGLTELQRFSNVASTRSSTNETNITLVSDELERLTGFVSEQFVKTNDQVDMTEEIAMTNKSNIEILGTRATDIESNVSSVNGRADSLLSLIKGVDSSVETMNVSVGQNGSSIQQVSSDLTDLALKNDALGDLIDLVDGNQEQTKDNLITLTKSWTELSAKAYVSDGLFNAKDLKAENCDLSIPQNDGANYGLRFGAPSTKNWMIYASNTAGQNPNGGKPLAHGEVTGSALRMKLDSDVKSGFIIENNSNQGVFSVSTTGATRMSNSKIWDTGSDEVAFGHHSRDGAIKQKSNGEVSINSGNNKTISFCPNGVEMASLNSSGGFSVLNDSSTRSTILNGNGHNIIYSAVGKGTHFRVGTSGSSIATINSNGLLLGSRNVGTSLTDLEARVASLESLITNTRNTYVQKGGDVRLYNYGKNRYLRGQSNIDTAKMDTTTKDNWSRFRVE